VAGKPDESALYKRLLLDLNHDDHMPPKGKPQLTNEEIKLLHWWITEGGHFDKKVKDLPKNEAINALMSHNFNKNKTAESELQMIPMQAVEKANQVVLDSLKKWGIAVLPVAPNSNYLSANLVSLMQSSNADVEKLLPLAKQLIWLKLGSIKMDDAALVTVGKLTNLTRLFLNNTDITDAGLQHLSGLTELQYLNLVNTKVTAQGLIPLSKLPKLKQLYVYKTAIKPSDYAQIKSLLPNTVIDTGGYVVPTWASDTSIFKR
jgi:hypothetical protein